MSRVTLVYDRDCGFCRWCLGKVLAWDRHGAVRPVALGTPEADRLLAEVSGDERASSWHLIGDDGEVRSAGAGFEPLLELLPAAGPLGGLARRFPHATERGYRLVSGNRSFFGKFVTEGAKRRADARIAERSGPQVAATSGRPT